MPRPNALAQLVLKMNFLAYPLLEALRSADDGLRRARGHNFGDLRTITRDNECPATFHAARHLSPVVP